MPKPKYIDSSGVKWHYPLESYMDEDLSYEEKMAICDKAYEEYKREEEADREAERIADEERIAEEKKRRPMIEFLCNGVGGFMHSVSTATEERKKKEQVVEKGKKKKKAAKKEKKMEKAVEEPKMTCAQMLKHCAIDFSLERVRIGKLYNSLTKGLSLSHKNKANVICPGALETRAILSSRTLEIPDFEGVIIRRLVPVTATYTVFITCKIPECNYLSKKGTCIQMNGLTFRDFEVINHILFPDINNAIPPPPIPCCESNGVIYCHCKRNCILMPTMINTEKDANKTIQKRKIKKEIDENEDKIIPKKEIKEEVENEKEIVPKKKVAFAIDNEEEIIPKKKIKREFEDEDDIIPKTKKRIKREVEDNDVIVRNSRIERGFSDNLDDTIPYYEGIGGVR